LSFSVGRARGADLVDIFTIYENLWTHAERLGAKVHYTGMGEEGAGSFHPNPWDRCEPSPAIEIVRRYYETIDRPTRERNASGRQSLPPPDLLCETVTLAHECGHFLSWRGRTPRDECDAYYRAARLRDEAWARVEEGSSIDDYNDQLRAVAQDALTEEQLQLILAEEERAWTFGRELLLDLGFDKLDYYDERARKGVYYHRCRLGMEPLRED